MTILRPPTFDRLREHLRERPDFYHIVHFDGHGSYQRGAAGSGSGYKLDGPVGRLIFETDDGQPDPQGAEQLSALLREFRIPAMVLNACQSAMVDERAVDPFASVAAALIQSGVRSVVAMSYSLFVSGAEVFLPAFYERLFETGDFAQATRAGRQQMFAHPGRVCSRGKFPLQDWLVPVIFQQDPPKFEFAKPVDDPFQLPTAPPASKGMSLPAEVDDSENPYGFVGRDSALLALERAMRRAPAGLLIAGLGGVGKTTLARGFVRWLHATDGLGLGCFWVSFQEVQSAESVINRLGEALFGANFGSLTIADRLDALTKALRSRPFLIVWDNFEVVRGIPGSAVEAAMEPEDQALLKTFLAKLRGGKTKVLITSRVDEAWLSPDNRAEIPIGGLQGEERWEFCEVILRDRGLLANRVDPGLVQLMDLLGGHPLSMRAILAHYTGRNADTLANALRSNLADLGTAHDEARSRLFATLRFVEQALPADLRPLLVPLALHEQFISIPYLEHMAKQVDAGWTRDRIDRFAGSLVAAGLLGDRGNGLFEIHPALTGFLRGPRASAPSPDEADAWSRAFVDLMGTLADRLAPKPLHEQREPFHVFGASFRHALAEAERLQLGPDVAALTRALAAFAQNRRDFRSAERLYERLAKSQSEDDPQNSAATTYHQLGRVAEERRDLDAAERWYLKSLAIKERQGNDHGAATTYAQLGIVTALRGDLLGSGRWLIRSIQAFERTGDPMRAGQIRGNFSITLRQASPTDQAELRRIWEAAGLGPFSEPGPPVE